MADISRFMWLSNLANPTMSREQPTQNLLDYYDDDFEDYEPEDISLYEMDNSAVEKAAYQIGMAGSIEPTALNNVSFNETPYGTGLSVQDIQEVVADYPGVAAGFDANEDLNELEDADSFYNLPEINDEYAKLEQKIEQQGLIGSEIDIVSNAGEKIGIQLSNNVDSVNFVSTPPSNFSEIMENISLDVLDEAHDLDDLDSAYIQLGNEVNAGQNTFATQSKIDEIENKISQRDFESTMDEMYATEGPRSVSEYLGDPKNYESGELDTDMVNEYMNKYDKTVNTTGQGFQEFSLIQNAVNNAKNTILQAARMDEPGADVETEELNTIAQYANQRAEDEEEIPTLPGRPPRETPFEETRNPYELSDLDPEFDEVVNTGYMGDNAARRELAREMGLENIRDFESASEGASDLMNVDTTNLPTDYPTLEEMILANELEKETGLPLATPTPTSEALPTPTPESAILRTDGLQGPTQASMFGPLTGIGNLNPFALSEEEKEEAERLLEDRIVKGTEDTTIYDGEIPERFIPKSSPMINPMTPMQGGPEITRPSGQPVLPPERPVGETTALSGINKLLTGEEQEFDPQREFDRFLMQRTSPTSPIRGALRRLQQPLLQQYYLSQLGNQAFSKAAGEGGDFSDFIREYTGKGLSGPELRNVAQEIAKITAMTRGDPEGEFAFDDYLRDPDSKFNRTQAEIFRDVYGGEPNTPGAENRKQLVRLLAMQRPGGGMYGGIVGRALGSSIDELYDEYATRPPSDTNFLQYYLGNIGTGVQPPLTNEDVDVEEFIQANPTLQTSTTPLPPTEQELLESLGAGQLGAGGTIREAALAAATPFSGYGKKGITGVDYRKTTEQEATDDAVTEFLQQQKPTKKKKKKKFEGVDYYSN